jgi:hypothetical protein
MEFISSITYFLRKLPKTRLYTLKCVMRPPAGDQATHLFRKSRIGLTASTNTGEKTTMASR